MSPRLVTLRRCIRLVGAVLLLHTGCDASSNGTAADVARDLPGDTGRDLAADLGDTPTDTPPADTPLPDTQRDTASEFPPDDTAEPSGRQVGFLQISESGVFIWGIFERPFLGAELGISLFADYVVTHEVGDCIYLAPAHPFCDPPCARGEICDPRARCVPAFDERAAGDLVVRSPHDELTIEPTRYGFYSLYTRLPDGFYAPGDLISVDAAGGDVPAFSTQAMAPQPLEGPDLCELTLEPGQDLEVNWVAGDGGATIRFELLTMMHAGNGPMLMCETEQDTGSLTVPAALIEHYALDRTAFETFQLTRYHHASAPVDSGHRVGLYVSTSRYCFHSPHR